MFKLEIGNALEVLNDQKTLLYPTDTVWGIGCDATCEKTVAKIFTIKQRIESKSLVILVDSIEMLMKYVPVISNNIENVLTKATDPTTIIYNNPIGLAKNVVSSDDTVAIRLIQNEFCKELIEKFGKPIVSTSANISGNATPNCFEEIEAPILDSVDYIVNLHREDMNEKSSTILKVDDKGEITVLRH